MVKRKASKRGKQEARREIETREGKDFPRARPMHEEIAEDAVAALVARAGREPEDEDGRTDCLLAREALKRLAFGIVDAEEKARARVATRNNEARRSRPALVLGERGGCLCLE